MSKTHDLLHLAARLLPERELWEEVMKEYELLQDLGQDSRLQQDSELAQKQ